MEGELVQGRMLHETNSGKHIAVSVYKVLKRLVTNRREVEIKVTKLPIRKLTD